MPKGWESIHGLDIAVDDSTGDFDGHELKNLPDYQTGPEEFGVVSTESYKLRKGAKDEVEIVHTGTKPWKTRARFT